MSCQCESCQRVNDRAKLFQVQRNMMCVCCGHYPMFRGEFCYWCFRSLNASHGWTVDARKLPDILKSLDRG